MKKYLAKVDWELRGCTQFVITEEVIELGETLENAARELFSSGFSSYVINDCEDCEERIEIEEIEKNGG